MRNARSCVWMWLVFCTMLGSAALTSADAIEIPGVVINEIMYESGSGSTLDEYIELFNSSTQAVDLTGWQFNKGVTFAFPAATLNAGAYLVIAADLATFHAKYPGVSNVIGAWTGRLSNSGETIQLVNAQGQVVDSVTYADQGDWAVRTRGPLDHNHNGWVWSAGHNGGGKSLELINPNMPNQYGQNWGASTVTGGTPGAANSIAATDIAPLIVSVQHLPIIPKSTDAVTVTAHIIDELDASATATIYYRADGAPAFTALAMSDDGLHGDGGVNDGVFGATLPAQTNGTVVEFYISATDTTHHTRTWPAPAQPTNTQLTNCLYQVDDAVTAATVPLFKLIMTGAERAELGVIDSTDYDSDAQMNGTFISVDGTGTLLRYNCGIRNRGHGSRHLTPHNFRVDFRSDEAWQGVYSICINAQYTNCQLMGSAIFRKCSIPVADSTLIHVRVNNADLSVSGAPTYGFYVHNESLDSQLIAKLYPTDSSGNLYRAVRQDPPGTAVADLSYQGATSTPYRLVYFKDTNSEADDWTDLIHLTDVLNNTPDATYTQEVNKVIDLDNWLRYFAVNAFLSNNETTVSSGVGDDYALYSGVTDTRFRLHSYDMDTILGSGDSPGTATDSIFRMTALPTFNRFIKFPDIAPQYFSYLDMLGNSVFTAQQFNALVDQTLGTQFPATVSDGFKNFMAQRLIYIKSQIPLALSVTTVPASVNGYAHTTTPSVTLGGKSNAIKTRSVLVNGVAATWTAWQATWSAAGVGLQPGINKVLIQALDASGAEFERSYVDVWYDKTAQALTGTLNANMVLTATAGPYHVTGNIIVPVGITLTIQPGTSLFFDPGFGIQVFGRLVAEGTDLLRIRMTRQPAATSSWNGILFSNTTQDNRLSYIDFEFADNQTGVEGKTNIAITNSTIYIDHATWSQTLKQLLTLQNSSMILKYSVLPTIDQAELVHSNVMPAAGYFVMIGNTLGGTTGYNDVCDLTGGNRPGPIMEIWNNTFLGGSDDCLDLDGTDVHIEGNYFTNIHKNNTSNSDSHAISTGIDSGNTSELTIARNVFVNCDHALLAKQGAFLTVQNNTIVGSTIAAINFVDEQTTVPPPTYGKGAIIDGNIFWNNAAVFENVISSVDVSIKNSIVPAVDLGPFVKFGTGNIVADPQFVSVTDFHLKSSSPARGSGPNGLDMGAYVPQGASVYGVPSSPTAVTTATLVVDGPAIVAYKYSLDGGAYSAETPVSVPIALTNLAPGSHSVSVLGKNDAYNFQDQGPVPTTATVSKSWTVVSSPLRRVLINEVLADNVTVFSNNNTWPDVIELYNAGSDIDLSDMSISDTSATPRNFVFPPNTLLSAGGYLLLLADSVTTAPGIHTGFGLKQKGEGVFLYDTLANGGGLLDSVVFGVQLTDRSIGRLADGSWALCVPTLGAANVFQPLGDPAGLKLNEWLASGQGQFKDDYIELYNPSPLPVALGGLYLTDNTLSEPLKSMIPALSFIDGTGAAGSGLIVYTADGNLANGADHVSFKLAAAGETIGLNDAGGAPIDSIEYGPQTSNIAQGRTPNGADAIGFFPPTPGLDNPVPATAGVTTTNLIPIANTWKYDQTDTSDPASWQTVAFNDAAWPSGAALLYNETATLPAAKNTPLSLGTPERSAYYFRTHFTFTGDPAKAILHLKTVIDDGAVFYLNGTEVYRLGMAAGTVTYATLANRTVSDAVFEGPFTIPGTTLVSGDNVMAVRVHQSALNSSDIVFGMTLDVDVSNVSSSVSAPVVINEIATNPAAGQTQFIEIFNPTASAADISGWYLTDDPAVPKKYLIPTTTPITAGGFASFDSTQFGASFQLNRAGGAVYLFSADPGHNLTGYSQGFAYEASDAGTSFGLYSNSAGAAQYPAQKALTPGAANAGPSVGPVVISEIMYHPLAGGDSFVELTNITGSTVNLYDAAHPANTWRVNGIGYSFAPNAAIPPSGVLIVSSIDPQLFRVKYNVPTFVQVVGPYPGTLSNAGELLELQKPGAPGVDGQGTPFIPYITVDAVEYGDNTPWPSAADGGGPSLERIDNNSYGNDPVNWRASVPTGGTPGNGRVWDGGGDGQFWTTFGNWDTNNLPIGSAATALIFKDAGLVPYAAANNLSDPFDLNNLILNTAVNGNGIVGQALNFAGPAPALLQNGGGAFSIASNMQTSSALLLGGDGAGAVVVSGTISGAGGIAKAGASSVELSGANTFTGGTAVNAGVLVVSNTSGSAAGTGAVTVGSGAMLRGTGAVAGALAVASGSVAPGTSAATGVLTAGGADFSAGGTLSIRARSPSSVDRLMLTNAGSTALLRMGGTSALAIDLTGFSGSGEFVIAQANAWSAGSGFASVVVSNAGANVATVSYKKIDAATQQILLAVNQAVTPVKIDGFRAVASGAGIRVSWNAVSEFQNAGFNVYRQALDSDAWTRVNPALINGRITAPDEKHYACYDWAPAVEYRYKLESIDLSGRSEIYAQFAGPVAIDLETVSADLESDDAAVASVFAEAGVTNAAVVGAKFAALDRAAAENASSGVRALAPREIAASVAADFAPRAAVVPSAGARWFSASPVSASTGSMANKVLYDKAGVLLIPQAMLTGLDIRHVSIQREGRNLSALALVPEGLLVYAPGYQDDYTDKDALFLRRIAGATQAGQFLAASGLFESAQAVNVTSPANVTVDYHDVYFDYTYRPYTFTPWFSAQYLTSGTTQSFALSAPSASGGPAVLTINLWSLTLTDHALQVVVNGQPVGTTLSWSGGNQAMQLTLAIPAGVLKNGGNQIDLVTPAPASGETQICFLNSLSVDYTRLLDGASPLEILNNGSTPQLCEVTDLPGAAAWVVDARFPDRAALVPVQTRADADGTYRLRFVAEAGGAGRYLVVPAGQENAPASVSRRQVKALRLSGTYLAAGPSQFLAGVQPLLALRTKAGIRAQAVDQEQLFDYYNYGRYGPAGIQNAVRATGPKYLLLLGRTTYDYRNYSGANVDPMCPTFLVPTTFWAQATSDSMFGDLGRGYPEVAVGRLPVNDVSELAGAVQRVLNYTGAPESGVRVHAVADRTDPDAADFGALADALAQSHPELAWQRNYLGTTYASAPEVTAAMKNAANGGADWILYAGHGNSVRLGKDAPRILQTDSSADNVKDWTGNVVLLQSSCTGNWMAANTPGFKSIAIEALTQPQGGISASIATSTYMNPECGAGFMARLISAANRSGMRWGDALMATQQWAAQQGSGFYVDLNKTEQLFGDPAMPVFGKSAPAAAKPAAAGGTSGTPAGTF